jgi:uncharacterized protein (DUF433 family)
MGRDRHVVVDPGYGWGLPVVAGSGVRTEILYERLDVGESIATIASGFNVTTVDVEHALEFERHLAQ